MRIRDVCELLDKTQSCFKLMTKEELNAEEVDLERLKFQIDELVFPKLLEEKEKNNPDYIKFMESKK